MFNIFIPYGKDGEYDVTSNKIYSVLLLLDRLQDRKQQLLVLSSNVYLSACLSVRPSICFCPAERNNSVPTGRIFMKSYF
jgi:hypothetical protein